MRIKNPNTKNPEICRTAEDAARTFETTGNPVKDFEAYTAATIRIIETGGDVSPRRYNHTISLYQQAIKAGRYADGYGDMNAIAEIKAAAQAFIAARKATA